jgi:hypothetical protein
MGVKQRILAVAVLAGALAAPSPAGALAWTAGLAGIEAGAGSGGWPQAEYRNLSITR